MGVLSKLESRKSERSLKHRLGQCSTSNEEILTAECSEKVLHHELLAAHAEQDRKILHEELRQQQEIREVRQQDLMRHLELQKFQNSESQKTIMDLSGRLQELQNEMNLMNDSKDFMDAESTCSGNLHVTSPPGLFPRHLPLEGLLKPVFTSLRQDEKPPNIWDTSGISGNVFANPQASSSAPYSQELNSSKWNPWRETTEEPIHKSIGREKRKTKARLRSEMPVRTVSQKFSSHQWRRLFKELWGRPTTTADFGSSF